MQPRSFFASLHDYCRSKLALIGVIALVCFLYGAVDLSKPVLYGMLFEYAIPDRDVGAFVWIGSLLAGTVVLQALGWLARAALISRVSAAVSAELQLRLLDRVQAQALSLADEASVAQVNELFTKHLSVLEKWMLTEAPRLFIAGIGAFFGLIMMFFMDWRLAVSTVVLVALAGVGPTVMSKRFQSGALEGRGELERRGLLLQDVVGMQRLIRVFNLQGYWRGHLAETVSKLRAHGQEQARRSLLTQGMTTMGVACVQVAVVCVGVGLAFRPDGPSMGVLVGFMTMLVVVVGSANLISESMPATLDAKESVAILDQWLVSTPAQTAELAELAEEGEEAEEGEGAEGGAQAESALAGLTREIELRSLSFAYTPGETILDELSLHIRAGESVALVGPSGSGKSTVLGVLMGFLRPHGGQLLWDGAALDGDEAATRLREHLGVVLQDTALFNHSAGENIRVGRLDASELELEAAARAAGIHEVITTMPEGYASAVGEGGGRLSGGQRQRIALARALVRKPSVLILDEATSALDPQTEAAVTETLLALAGEHTIISVTHRLHTIEGFDRIFVLKEGRVVESGNHAELVEAEGLYAAMHRKQSGIHVSADGSYAKVEAPLLAEIPALALLDEQTRERVAERLISERFEPGEVIVREGQIGERVYLIARGRVDVFVSRGEQRSVRVGSLMDGDYFGEMALLENIPRRASVIARTATVTLSLSKAELEYLLDQTPGIREMIEIEQHKRREILDELEGGRSSHTGDR